MTDEMIWALREKCAKGATTNAMHRAYGIPVRIIAAVTGAKCYRTPYWRPEDLWRVREMLREGKTVDDIADEFGTTHKTIANVINNNRDLFKAFDRRG